MAQEKILIVEDEMLIALGLETRLESFGYSVCAKVLDSESAIEAVKKFYPDLVLMDIRIKGPVDGIETAKQIQAITFCPIIFITAYLDENTLDRAKATMPYGYLNKPVQERDLRITIQMALHKSKIEKELRRTKEELEWSEHRNRILVDALPDLIFRVSKDGTILDYSAPAMESTPLPRGLFLNTKISETLPQAIRSRAIHAIEKSIEKKSIEVFEYEMPVDLQLKKYEVRSTKLNDNEALVITRDVTDQKQAEDLLRKSQEQLAGITANLPGIVFQFTTDPDGNKSISYADGKLEEMLGLSREKESLFNQFVERIHPDYLQPFLQSVEYSVKNFVPWHFEGKFNKSSGETIWLRGLSTPVKHHPVMVFNGIILDITGQKQSEEALITSEEKFRILVENSPIGIYYVNLKGDFLYGNKVAEEIIGYSKEEMIGKNFLTIGLLSFKDVLLATKLFALNLLGKPTGPDQFELHRKDGRRVQTEIKTQVITFSGQKVVMGMVQDITERKQSEEALRESEEKYRFMFAKNPQPMWIYDLETLHFLEVNNSALDQYGYTKEEFLSMTLKDIRPAEDVPDFLMEVKMTQKEYNSAGEWRHIKKNGEIIFVEITSHFLTFNGRPARHVLIKDITARKQVEEALIESEDRYRDLIENSSDLICTHDLDGNLLSVNKVAATITGYSEKELQKMTMQDIIVPEYQRLFKAYLAKIKAIGKAKGLLTIQTKAGERRIWEYNNTLRTHGIDKPIVRGMVRDITEQKKAQALLQESELRFKQVAENVREWIWEVDKNGLYTYASSVSKDVTGYEPEEIVGKKYFYDFFDEVEKEKIKQLAFEVFARKENFKDFVNINRHKDGSEIILSTSGVPMLDSKGNLIGYRGVDIDITGRKRAEEEILMLAHSLRSINESVVITDMEDNIIFINESFLETYSYSEDELIGKHISIVHPLKNPPELIKEILPATLYGGWKGELLNRRKNGNEFPIYLSTSVVRNREGVPIGLIGVIQDITERKKIEKELQDYRERLEDIVEERTHELQLSEEKFRVLAESSEDTIMRFNRKYQHLYVNPQVNKQTGIKAEAFLGKKHSELGFPEHLVLLWETTLENVFKSKEKNRIEFQLPNGIWMDWILVPEIEENGEVQTVITSGRDITKLKEYEAEINKALQKEKELSELKSRFISTVSHEFRTPLASILSSTQLIQRYSKKWDEVKLNEHHERIKYSITKLTELLDDVLALSKSESQRKTQETINLKEELTAIIHEVHPLLTPHHILEFNYEREDQYVNIDKTLIKLIFSNLLSNAIKFSPQGGQIKLLVNEAGKEITFELSDQGMGIDENELPNIYDPFYRSKKSEHIKGSGLGLSIVKQSIAQCGGIIETKSKVGEGTIVKIKIPIQEMYNEQENSTN